MSEFPVYTKNVKDVVEKESEYIQKRRRKVAEEFSAIEGESTEGDDLFPDNGKIGLSFSGGGLRSATFNLGVVQALAKHGILPFVDYLSTVSGGGYLGSSLTSLLNLHRHSPDASGFCEDDCESSDHPDHGDEKVIFPYSTQYKNFPLNPDFDPFRSATSVSENTNLKGFPDYTETNSQLSHMRRSGNFLIQRVGLLSRDLVRTIGAVISGLFYSLILFSVTLFLLASLHYVAMGTLVPGIADEGITTTVLLNEMEGETNTEEAEQTLFTLYDDMVAASFQKYKPDKKSFSAAPAHVYPIAIGSGIGASILWVMFVIPYYGRFESQRKAMRKRSKTIPPEKDPDLSILALTALFHFIIIMVVFISLRLIDSDKDASQLYWMWYPFFYIAATAASGYILFYIFSLKPILQRFFNIKHDLSARQRSIFYSYVGIQTQGAILVALAAFLAIPHYFTVVTPTTGLTVPGGAAIVSGLWAYYLQRKAKSSSGGSTSAKLKLSFSTIKFALNLLVMVLVLSSIFMIEVLFEQVNFQSLIEGGKLIINFPGIRTVAKFFFSLTQSTVSIVGIEISSLVLLMVIIAILLASELWWMNNSVGKLVRRIAKGTYYKNGFRLILIPFLVLLALNVSYTRYFERHNELVVLAVIGVMLYFFLLIFGLINANNISLHYFYRDRIADAFLKTDIVNVNDEPIVARDNRSLLLSSTNYEGSSIPYHLVMGAVSLQGSKDLKLKGRKTAPFTFSKYYCGSDITGFVHTREYRGNTNKLARAVTISGAAFSSSVGILTFFGQAFMLTLINLRLGMWLKNPSLYSSKKSVRSVNVYKTAADGGRQQNVFQEQFERLMTWVVDLIETWAIWPRYLFEEATGSMNEDLPLVNVTDGGHFENMGLYPLLQRRCKLIISGDASADPEHAANDLARVVRQINVDENIDIDIDLNSLTIDDSGKCPQHFTVGKITYRGTNGEEDETGHLIYIKPSMTGDEPIDITNYWRANKKGKFPHQSTADQFYDEHQFEAYRHLGEHSVDSMLKGLAIPKDPKKRAAFVSEHLAIKLKEELEDKDD